jgi:TatA/E family protein of Tat protein translocase
MGAGEIMVIMIVALLIFGPGKLPEIMGQVGRTVREFKKATRDLTGEFQDSIHDVQSTMDEMKTTVSDMKRETTELAASIPTSIESSIDADGLRAAASVATADGTRTAAAQQPRTRRNRAPTQSGAGSEPDSPTSAIDQSPARAAGGANGASAAVATKADPFADLVELDDALEPTDSGSRE